MSGKRAGRPAAWLLALAAAGTVQASVSRVERASVSSAGQQGNDSSSGAVLSADGRFVGFTSYASNLVPGDTNNVQDAFVHDRQTRRTERVSLTASGGQATAYSTLTALSADGRYALLASAARLVPEDTDNAPDVYVHDRQTQRTEWIADGSAAAMSADGRFIAYNDFSVVHASIQAYVHDRQTGQTVLASVNDAGVAADSRTEGEGISADGRFLVMTSTARNLTPHRVFGSSNVFVRDLQTGKTELISLNSREEPGAGGDDGGSRRPEISANSRFVAFMSDASNLVPGDGGDEDFNEEIFVRDRQTGETEKVSLDNAGRAHPAAYSRAPAISADGRYVAFESEWHQFVPGEENSWEDVFIRDRVADRTVQVSRNAAGQQGSDASFSPALSSDGKLVAFTSDATNLVPADTNRKQDVFVAEVGTAQNNRPPAADAGPDRTLRKRSMQVRVQLDGSRSSDPDRDPLTYLWTNGDKQVATTAKPTVRLRRGRHTLTLKVTDSRGASDTDTVQITIRRKR